MVLFKDTLLKTYVKMMFNSPQSERARFGMEGKFKGVAAAATTVQVARQSEVMGLEDTIVEYLG